jgi:Uncharacterised protein family (UPF0175)
MIHYPATAGIDRCRMLLYPLVKHIEKRMKEKATSMEVTINLPDDVVQRLQAQWGDVPRRMLEDLVLDGYQAHILGESDIRRLLGFETRFEVHDFLCKHQVPFYTLEDLQRDRETSQRLGL